MGQPRKSGGISAQTASASVRGAGSLLGKGLTGTSIPSALLAGRFLRRARPARSAGRIVTAATAAIAASATGSTSERGAERTPRRSPPRNERRTYGSTDSPLKDGNRCSLRRAVDVPSAAHSLPAAVGVFMSTTITSVALFEGSFAKDAMSQSLKRATAHNVFVCWPITSSASPSRRERPPRPGNGESDVECSGGVGCGGSATSTRDGVAAP